MMAENICYAAVFMAEALTTWLYFEYLFSRKKGAFFLASTGVLGYAALFFISLLDNTTWNAIAFCIVNFFWADTNYRCTKRMILLHTAFLCFVMVGAEILVAILISQFGHAFAAYTYNFKIMVVLMVLSKLLYLLFSAVGARIFSPHKYAAEDPQLMALFCALPLLSASLAIVIVFWAMNVQSSDMVAVMSMLMISTLLAVNLLVLVLYNYLQKTNEKHLALQLSIQKEQADIAYYKALQEQYESQRVLIHDIKRHLAAIDILAKQNANQEIEKYISSLNTSFSLSSQAKLCADPILNLVLLHFRDLCKAQDIDFLCDVRCDISDFMDSTSITALYGNLLSNALEAAVSSEKKQIELSVTKNILQSVIVLSVVNTCDAAPIPDGSGGFYTKKAKNGLHGIGLRSIDRVVKKYNGVAAMYYGPDERRFHHIIQFPIPI